MDKLIEKIGFKKMAIVVGIVVLVLIFVLIFLKKTSSSESNLFKCSKSANYYSLFNLDVEVSISEINNKKVVKFNNVIKYRDDISVDDIKAFGVNIGDNLEASLSEYFFDFQDDVSYYVEDDNNSLIYGYEIVLNNNNYEAVSSYLNYDYYSNSIDDAIVYLEGSGFTCVR